MGSLTDKILGEAPHSAAPEPRESPSRTVLGNIDFGGRRLDKVPEYTSYLAQLESDYELPKGLLGSIMRAESAGQNDARSPKGARGAFQFMPATAREYGIDPLDPVQSADGAARYLRKSLDKFGNLPEAVASYNAGPGRISKTGVKGAPRETRSYVQKVLGGILDFVIPAAEASESETRPVAAGPSITDRILGGAGTNGPAMSSTEPTAPASVPSPPQSPGPSPEDGPSPAEPMRPGNRPSITDRILGGGDGSGDLEGKTLQQARDDEISWPVEKDPVSTWTAFKSGFASDPETQIRLFASKRFPNEPIERAMARYRLDKNGDLVFRGDDGKTYAELDTLAKVAQGVGEWAPTIGGTIVGGFAGGPLGAVGGGAAGEAARKTIATAVLDEPREPVRDAVDMTLAGVTEGVGWKAGDLGTRYINRRTARDVATLTPERRAEAQRIVDIGQREGIHVTPAEATDLPSLRGQQTYLGNTHGPAGDKVGDMYKGRNAATQAAIERHLPQAPHLTTAGAEAKPVFDAELERVYKARTEKVTPEYEKVVHPGALLSEEAFAPIKADRFLADEIAAVKSTKLNGMQDLPDESLPVLDKVKKNLDVQIGAAKRDGNRDDVRLLTEKRDKVLLQATDRAFPDYPKARAAHVEATPEVKEAERSLAGVIAKLSDRRLANVANEVFSATKNTAGPVRVGEGRALFEREGKKAEWDNLLNAWLRKEWEAVPDRRVNPASSFRRVNPASSFYDRIYGSETKRNILSEAMGPDRFRSFNDLMTVLEATTRVQGGQSITHFAGEAAKETGRKAAPVASVAGRLKPSTLRDWWIDKKTGRYNETLADIITNPGAMEKLKELRKLDPRSEKAINIVGTVLSAMGLDRAQDTFNPPTYRASGAGSTPPEAP
jgi:Transglycosylase SLT domain